MKQIGGMPGFGFALALFGGLVGCSSETSGVEVTSEAIIHGTPDKGYPEAVLVQWNGHNYTYACSGVLLAPSVAMTAGHCV